MMYTSHALRKQKKQHYIANQSLLSTKSNKNEQGFESSPKPKNEALWSVSFIMGVDYSSPSMILPLCSFEGIQKRQRNQSPHSLVAGSH